MKVIVIIITTIIIIITAVKIMIKNKNYPLNLANSELNF